MDPIVGGALIAGAGSLLSGLFGRKSQSDANRTNLQIARETNENQYRMFKEGNDFSARMANEAWNRETAYNDPAAQLARYQRAGINGQVAMSGSLGSAGTTAADMAAPQSLSPPQLHAPTVQPLPNSLSAISEMASVVGQLYQAKKNNADADRIIGLFEAQLEGAIEANKYQKLQNTYQSIQNNILTKTGLDKAFGELREQNARILLNDQMSETEKSKRINLIADAFLKRAERKLTNEKYNQLVESWPLVKKELEENIKLIQAKQQTETTQQEANKASAAASYSTVQLNQASAEEKKELANQLSILNKYLDKRQQRELRNMSIDKKLQVLDGMVKNGFMSISGSSSSSAGGNVGFGSKGSSGSGKGFNLGLGLDQSKSVSGSRSENVFRDRVQKEYERILDDLDLDGEVQYKK